MVDSARNRLYAAYDGNYGDYFIIVFDATTHARIAEMLSPVEIPALLLDSERNRVFFGTAKGSATHVLDGDTLQISAVPVQFYDTPTVLGDENRFYSYAAGDSTLQVTNLETGVSTRTETLLSAIASTRANVRANRVYAHGLPKADSPYNVFMLDPNGGVLGRIAVPMPSGGQAAGVNTATGVLYIADGDATYVIADAGAVPPFNTPTGADVTIAAPDADATVKFATVSAPGETTMTPIADAAALNLTLPGGFALSTSTGAWEISTTATIGAPIEVCLSAAGLTDEEFANATILHGVDGAWQVEASRRDATTRMICAEVTSLSPFAIGLLVDREAPQVSCSPVATGWHRDNVTVTCTASDTGIGLATAADASFALTTSLPAGSETANATTDSRQVCDAAGNCATAGPIGGIKIDMRAPAIQVTAPAERRYLLAERVTAAYGCTDGGAGVASCAGPVEPGAPIDTATVGARAFTVNAVDEVGNASAMEVAYSVGYGIQPLYDPTRAYKAGSTVNLIVALTDANGRNVSSPAITVVARKLTRLQDGMSMTLGFALPYDTKSGGYGGKVNTGGLSGGTYEVELEAAGDTGVLHVRFTLK